jgi:arginase
MSWTIPRTVRLLGAPSDVGASCRGASMGPEALRVAGLQRALQAQGLQVTDSGNVNGPANPGLPPVAGYRHLHEVQAWSRAVHVAVLDALTAGELPLLMGGDHALSIGSISAVARHCHAQGRPLRVLWLDAHADFNTSELTLTGNLHGMPLAILCGQGPDELTQLSGFCPALLPSAVRQVGIRSVDAGEKQRLSACHLEVFDMRHIDENGMRSTMQSALAGWPDDAHLHVSFDVDFLDPSVAPGVATTERGGPTYREAQLCMEMIADTGRLASLDLMEINPALDLRNQTAEVAVDLLQSLFGKRTLMRPSGAATRPA